MEILEIYLLGVFAALIVIAIEEVKDRKQNPNIKTTIGELLVYIILLTLSWASLFIWIILNHQYIGDKWGKFVNIKLF